MSNANSYKPMTPVAIRRRLAKVRRMCPTPFPLEIKYSERRPSWTEANYDAGIWVEHEGNRVERAEIWISPRHSRAAFMDCLWHELAHALCIADDPEHGLALLHDNRFWLKYGEIWRAWMLNKYGPGGD